MLKRMKNINTYIKLLNSLILIVGVFFTTSKALFLMSILLLILLFLARKEATLLIIPLYFFLYFNIYASKLYTVMLIIYIYYLYLSNYEKNLLKIKTYKEEDKDLFLIKKMRFSSFDKKTFYIPFSIRNDELISLVISLFIFIMLVSL